ncbi:Gamma-tubulin complex component [Forsythia ovata]|uniref:Gamma-tubulin complex component n=1 Tax=Forsythia ovata TaxID=205694 RepID=A0ABD1NY98_9LAMI
MNDQTGNEGPQDLNHWKGLCGKSQEQITHIASAFNKMKTFPHILLCLTILDSFSCILESYCNFASDLTASIDLSVLQERLTNMINLAKIQRQSNNKSSEPGSLLGEGRKDLARNAREFLQKMAQDIEKIAKEYSFDFESFISQLAIQQHVDLKFLMFRLDFTEFYSELRPSTGMKL